MRRFHGDVWRTENDSIIVEPFGWGNLLRMKAYSHPDLRDVSLPTVMRALSDPCRLAIVRALLAAGGRELACSQVPLKISKATRSHHFEVLRDVGLIRTRVAGTKCLSSLREKEFNRRFPGMLKAVREAKG